MAKFNIPRIARPVDLGKYAPEVAAAQEGKASPIWVWVNPSREMRERFLGIWKRIEEFRKRLEQPDEPLAETDPIAAEIQALTREINAWWADMFSQGAELSNHWTVEEVEQFQNDCMNSDPNLWPWIQSECWRMITAYVEREKKG